MSEAIALIGSTGSVGRQTLEVIAGHADKWRAVALGARENMDLLAEQILRHRPQEAGLIDGAGTKRLREIMVQDSAGDIGTIIHEGPGGWEKMAVMPSADTVFFASSGVTALPALYAAIKARKRVALANKEMIVEEGEKIMAAARKNRVEIVPVDSEHSAIHQCLRGEDPDAVEKIILTCSGGPFYGRPGFNPESITVSDALSHPVWKMGAKISVDSATLMNKAFEIIEAKHLFGLREDQIEVVIHPQGIVHSLVQFKDGSVKAQMGLPDMKIPITWALSCPERVHAPWPRIDFAEISKLTFIKPDFTFFCGPELARAALNKGADACARLRRANDEAVQKFLSGGMTFAGIYPYIKSKTGL